MALGFKYFTSADVGAPVLNPVAGSLTNVLDWVLDTSDATNGWEIVYTATNKRVYRSRYGIRDYFRIDDTAGGGVGLVRAYETMSDVDTGVDPFPLVAQVALANGKWSHTFTTSGSIAWDYYGIKTARFMMLIKPTRRTPETPTGAADIFIMGELPPVTGAGADPHCSVLSIHPTSGAPTSSDSPFNSAFFNATQHCALAGLGQNSPGPGGLYMRRNRAGTVKSMPCRTNGVANNGSPVLSTTLAAGEPLTLVPLYIGTGESLNTETIRNVRATLPGLYTVMNNLDASWNKGDTFIDQQGRPYVYLRSTGANAGTGAILALGITDEHGAV